MALHVFTIGHSNRPFREFLDMLLAHEVQQLVDVRTIPRSGHNPQFNRDELSRSLQAEQMHYRHMPGLGGLRRPLPNSINTAWRNTSFRGYADYMQTDDFAKALNTLIDLMMTEPCAIMCAEAVPWRCHRSLIADALLARGAEVEEIVTATRLSPLVLHPWAKVHGAGVTYPAAEKAQQSLNLSEDNNRLAR